MKIELGKYYRRRDGVAWGPVCESGNKIVCPFAIENYSYHHDGSHYYGEDSPLDLISEVSVSDVASATDAEVVAGLEAEYGPLPKYDPETLRQLLDEPKPLDATDLRILNKLRKQGFLKPAAPDQSAKKRAKFRRETAAKVLAGLMANATYAAGSWENAAKGAVLAADALIKELGE